MERDPSDPRREEREEDSNEYGGMEPEIYDAIVHYKKTGEYPSFADQRLNRNAHFHWRLRCQNFILSDNDTLLYYNQNGHGDPSNTPRIVVKKGEARAAVKIVHERIGHAGQKQTHIAVAKRLYWRSIRRDTIRFVFECEVCQKKKAIRNRSSQGLPDAVELYVSTDPPPLDASEAVVAGRLLLNDSSQFVVNEEKDVDRIQRRQVFEYVDDDVEEFSEMVDDIDEENVDVIHDEDYIRSVARSNVGDSDVRDMEDSEEIIDPVGPPAPRKRCRMENDLVTVVVDDQMQQSIVNAPSRMIKNSSSSSEGYMNTDGVPSGTTNCSVSQPAVALMCPPKRPTTPVKRSESNSKFHTKRSFINDRRESDNKPLQRLARVPKMEEHINTSPSHYPNFSPCPSTSTRYSRAPRMPVHGGSYSAYGVRRGNLPAVAARKSPTYFDDIPEPSLGAAGTIVSADRDVIRLQKQVLSLQRDVYLLKRQYLQMKIDNFHYCHPQNVQIMDSLEEGVVPPDEAPVVAGNEEVPAEGSAENGQR